MAPALERMCAKNRNKKVIKASQKRELPMESLLHD